MDATKHVPPSKLNSTKSEPNCQNLLEMSPF